MAKDETKGLDDQSRAICEAAVDIALNRPDRMTSLDSRDTVNSVIQSAIEFEAEFSANGYDGDDYERDYIEEVDAHSEKFWQEAETAMLIKIEPRRPTTEHAATFTPADVQLLRDIWTQGANHRHIHFDHCNALLALIQRLEANRG